MTAGKGSEDVAAGNDSDLAIDVDSAVGEVSAAGCDLSEQPFKKIIKLLKTIEAEAKVNCLRIFSLLFLCLK
ncbi:hypothetical protein [Microcoleus sp. FACHB-672]|uniref:hypothetical protein n=1 Tax=Microcoleus sp. FACHB-672 TaxID=2692825 RepID=UPI001684EAA3|nr:hypothetical protein [Microcoleus sp. FACHB-672]MBD2042894.1 hypothetical protein [Microcoleus sp. FACHB-672]